MLIKSEFDVTEPPDKVWAFFNDIPLVASCLPGADISEQVDDDRFIGTVVIGLGPVRLNFAGEANVTERDKANRRIVVEASGADVKGRGQAALLVNASLVAAGGGTKVLVDQDLQLSGAAAQYGRGLVQDVTAVLLEDFASNMRQQLDALQTGVAFAPSAASSASGFTIGLRALRLALARAFRRFFLPYQPPTS